MPLLSHLIRIAGPIGGYALARQICRLQPRILMYHRFGNVPGQGKTGRDSFEKQIRYIRDHYRPMTLAQLLEYIFRENAVPDHAVVVTVDDGYRDFYEVAFPILSQHGVPATVFAVSGFVAGRLWLWPDKITWLLGQVQRLEHPLHVGDLRLEAGEVDDAKRYWYWRAIIDYLLSLPNSRKHQEIDRLAGDLGVTLPENAPPEFAAMNWDNLRELEQAGFEIGGHTVTHPSLGRVGADQAREEISGCRGELDQNLGVKPRTFCYPNGQPDDFSPNLESIVAEAGFLGAVTAFPDALGVSQRYAMRRHSAGDNMFQFFKAVSGAEYLGHRLRGTIRLNATEQSELLIVGRN